MSQVSPQETQRTAPIRVVLALPEADWAKALVEALRRAGFVPHCTPSPEVAAMVLSFRDPVGIFLDMDLLQKSGFRLLDTFRVSAPHAPLFVIAEGGDGDRRLQALAHGAEDCLVRPFSPQEAVIRLRRVMERQRATQRLRVRLTEAQAQAERGHESAEELRGQLRRDTAVLSRTIDFQQRLVLQSETGTSRQHLLRHLHAQLGVTPLALLHEPHPGATELLVEASWGLDRRHLQTLRLAARGSMASLLEAAGAPLLLRRLAAVPGMREDAGVLAMGGFTAAVPVLAQGRLGGIVLLGEVSSGGAPDDATLRLAHFLVAAVAPGLEAEARWSQERTLSRDTLSLLVDRLEGRNAFLHGHAQRVAAIAEKLADLAGLDPRERSGLLASALLHDIGRFEVDPSVWSRTERLSAADWRLVRRHPVDGERMLEAASWPDEVLASVRHHHERWDGTGYPDGLAGEAIPRAARLLALADSMDALTSPRPHRAAHSRGEALRVIEAGAGTQYDPSLVEAILRHPEAMEALVGPVAQPS